MSLVMEATAQSPERRAKSSPSAAWKRRGTSRSVSSFDISRAPVAGRSNARARALASPKPHRALAPRECAHGGWVRSAALSTVSQALPPGASYGLLRGDLGGGLGLDRDIDPPVALGGELDVPLRLRKQRMVGAHADVGTRMPLGAALARKDITGQHELAAVLLDAETPTRGIAAVARGT